MTIDDKKKPRSIIRFAIQSGVLLFLVLACMRFYAIYLEQDVAAATRAIEQLSMQEISLKQQLSALKSPNRIYSYCKDKLKMQKSASVGLLKTKKGE